MNFHNYLYQTKKDFLISAFLTMFFSVFYVIIQIPLVSILKNWENINVGPFHEYAHVAFRFNLFNFDPSMYYGSGGNSLIHPFLSFISSPLLGLAQIGSENLIFLIVQSVLVGFTVSLVYIYGIRNHFSVLSSLLISLLFGFTTYSIIVSVVPDSYPYAQFVIVLSIIYLQYIKSNEHIEENDMNSVVGLSSFAILNFGITVTNAIPYAISVAIIEFKKDFKPFVIKMLKIAGLSLIGIAALTFIDYFYMSGSSWVTNWSTSLEKGGLQYATAFSWDVHKHVLNSLFIAPIFFPLLEVVDPTSLMAIVTHNTNPFSPFIKWIGTATLLLSLLGIVLNLNKKKVWILVSYLLFNVFLHLVIGFGLVAHNYDLLLYAGHYLITIILGIGWLLKQTQSIKILHYPLVIVLVIIIGVQIIHNISMLDDLRNLLQIYLK